MIVSVDARSRHRIYEVTPRRLSPQSGAPAPYPNYADSYHLTSHDCAQERKCADRRWALSAAAFDGAKRGT
jgi:hypothetical protein